MAKKRKRIAVCDSETDPFLYGRIPKPFAWGFLTDDGEYVQFWGDNCTVQFKQFLETLDDEFIIYAHNGGKFDFGYLIDDLRGATKIINGRIAVAKLGKHTLQDSYCALPVALKQYDKTEIAYWKFEETERETYKAEISAYLYDDCRYLMEMINAFNERFGRRLTIGGAAINELAKLHPFDKLHEAHDTKFRPFYFGGRVDYFEHGVINGDFKIYDVNSMYPTVMMCELHPTGKNYTQLEKRAEFNSEGEIIGYEGKPYFLEFEGWHGGLLPSKGEKGALSFAPAEGVFLATSHEIKTGFKYGKVRIDKVVRALIPDDTINFKAFVDKFYSERLAAKASGDKIQEILCKLILNSAYGKFATDPQKFYDWIFVEAEEAYEYSMPEKWDNPPDVNQRRGWEFYEDFGGTTLMRRKSKSKFGYFDVATAASITGASRARLAAAIFSAERPVYCDTDSLICEKLTGVEIDAKMLGAWKCEGEADTVYIAGKKLYAVSDKKRPQVKCAEHKSDDCDICAQIKHPKIGDSYAIKHASKGAKLTPAQVAEVAKGGHIEWKSESPNFSLAKHPIYKNLENDEEFFIKRNIVKRAG